MNFKSMRTLIAIGVIALFAIVGSTLLVQAQETTVAPETARTPALNEAGQAVYIVQLEGSPLASYRGEIAGLAATSPAVTNANKLDVNSPAAQAYRNYLADNRTAVLNEMAQLTGRDNFNILYTYELAYNGMAIELTPAEAAQIAKLPGVAYVVENFQRYIQTDTTPEFINAWGIWDGTNTVLTGTQGAEIVVGVIDTGINMGSPSFADVGDDGYDHTNPRGQFYGWCNPTHPSYDPGLACNDKLIGVYSYPDSGNNPIDDNGHGSHTASTAAGNVVYDVEYDGFTFDEIAGMAPHANIIAYDVCTAAGCQISSILAALDDTIADQVDVINYSIGGGPTNPWADPDSLAYLAVRDAGIFVATSAGNSGPGPGTVGSPANSPWLTSVGNSTIGRVLANTLDVTGPGVVPPELQGIAALRGPDGPEIPADIARDIVFAGDVDPGNVRGCAAFPAGSFTNSIALIQRGDCTFFDKVTNATNAGADAAIIYNNSGGPPIVMGGLAGTTIPSVFVAQTDGEAVVAWVQNETDPTARINTGVERVVNPVWADTVAAGSSRGPNVVPSFIKPDIAAPGTNILAAVEGDPNNYSMLSGTSMASPHVAGAAALMRSLYPSWTPAEIQSALMMTSWPDLLKEDSLTPADAFDIGAGRLDLTYAALTGLVLDETTANFEAADPGMGGDPTALNLASLANPSCVGQCTWTRTFSSVLSTPATYTITFDVPVSMTMTADPAVFTINPGATQVVEFTADVSDMPVDVYAFGTIMLETDAVHTPAMVNAPTDVLLTEDFEGASFPPTDWTLVNLGGDCDWTGDDPGGEGNLTGGTGLFADANSDFCGSGTTMDAVLQTPLLDLSSGAAAILQFAYDYRDLGVADRADVDISTDNGATWTTIWTQGVNDRGPKTATIDLTPYLGSTETYIRFRYVAPSWDWWWQIDDVVVETFATVGQPVADNHLPLAVMPVSASLPDAVSIETMYRSGSVDVTDLVAGEEITDLTAEYGGLFAADMAYEELSQDPTNGDPYDNLANTFYVTTTVPANAVYIVAEILASEAPDLDLFVGTGDTPSAATEVCASTTGSWNEYCAIDAPAAGTWWMLVQNWQGSANQPDAFTFAAAVVTDVDEDNITVDGPATVPPGTPFDLTLNWDEPALMAGEKWYGFFTLGTDAANAGNIGTVWVDLLYTGAPAVDVDAAISNYQPEGMVMTGTLHIANVGDAALDWEIVEEAPPASTAVTLPGVPTVLPELAKVTGLAAEANAPFVNAAPRAVNSEVLWEQVVNGTSGIVSDYFIGSNAGAYSASDFVFDEAATIEYIFTPGFDNFNALAAQPAINWAIYADAGGVPAGNPEDGTGMASALWSYSAPVNGAGVDITDNNIALDLVAAGEMLNLPAGTYWLTVYPDYDVTGAGGARWNWYQAAQVGAETQLISPGIFGVGSWTSLSALGVTFFDTAFRIEGTPGAVCNPGDISWLSLPVTSGTVAAGGSVMVDVVFDSTGLADGIYTGQLCVSTNDPMNPTTLVDVELEVGDFAQVQVAHLAPFAMDPGTAVTVTVNSANALTDFAYGDSTGYLDLAPGSYDLAVWPAGSASPAMTATVMLDAGVAYSVVATGDGVNQPLELVALVDDNSAPTAGTFKLRLGHLAPFAAGDALADIRLQDGTPVLTDVAYADITGYIELPAGTYDLKVTTPGGDTTLIDPLPVTFADGDIITAFATGEGSNQALGVFAWPPDAEGFFLPLFESYTLYLPLVLQP